MQQNEEEQRSYRPPGFLLLSQGEEGGACPCRSSAAGQTSGGLQTHTGKIGEGGVFVYVYVYVCICVCVCVSVSVCVCVSIIIVNYARFRHPAFTKVNRIIIIF